MIISTLSLKGGAGKTTLCANLAVYFASKKYSVIIVDTDKNRNIEEWITRRNDKEVEKINYVVLDNPGAFRDNFDRVTKDFDIVVIDGKPAVDEITAFVLSLSNIALFPIIPSPLDMWTNQSVFLERFEKAREHNPDIVGAYVMNRVKPGTNLFYECQNELYEYRAESDIITLDSVISDRIIYAESLIHGLGVLETRHYKARGEFRKLGDEIVKILKS